MSTKDTAKNALRKLFEGVKPIPGFRVMDWLRKVRDERYELEKNDPEAYAMNMKRIHKKWIRRMG